jgi:hypothetical protein
VLLATLGVALTFGLADRVSGPRAALSAALLTATDPTFVMLSRVDFGPVALAFTLRVGILLSLVHWWKSGGSVVPFVTAAALLGLGVYDKTNFLWFVLALGAVGLPFWAISRKRPRLGGMSLAAALVAGLAASAPLWIYNLRHDWITFRMITLPGESFSFAKLLHDVPLRNAALRDMLTGVAPGLLMFSQAPTSYLGIGSTALLPLSAVALGALLITSLWARRPELALIPALTAAMLVQIYLTPRPVWVHHWIGVYPLPHLAIGCAVGLAFRHAETHLAWRAAARWLAVLAVATTLCLNVMIAEAYHRLMTATGGTGRWSDAIYELAEALKARYAERPIQIMDWGLGNQLSVLSAGQLRLREPFWAYIDRPQSDRRLDQLVADPTNVFLVHAPGANIFNNPRTALNDAAHRSCRRVGNEEHFFERSSRMVLVLMEFTSRECAR